MAAKGLVGMGRVVLANRERPIIIESMGSGLRGITLRYAHEVRSEAQYFADIAALGIFSGDPNWLLGSGFCRSRCWPGYHNRIGNRLRNVDGFRAGLMSTNHARSP
jgi:hypothetical protein